MSIPAGAGPGQAPKLSRSAVAGTLAIALGAALGAAGTLSALGSAGVQAAALGGHESAGVVLTTLAAYLFTARMRRTGAMVDVMLAAGLALLSAVNLAVVILPAGAAELLVAEGGALTAWAGLAVASTMRGTAPRDPLASADRLLKIGLLAALAVVAALAALAEVAGLEALTGDLGAGITVVGLLTAGLAGWAVYGFGRRCARSGDTVMLWLAVAAAVLAVAHLADAIVTVDAQRELAGGGIVRVAGWVALLVAGLRDFEWAHDRRAEVAVIDERKRLARELHDGLAQELAYISAETRRLAGHGPNTHLATAAERALEESRAAILALSRPADEPLERLIHDTARSIAERAGVEVIVAVRPGLDAPRERRQALVRILRESMTNAVRHGRARCIRVSVDGPAPLVMAVADDGIGFDVHGPRRPDSLGLQSMAERAGNLGGRLNLDSSIGSGTTVAVVLP